MRVLIIKTSSMGDVIHTLPALTDAQRALPNVTFDWVVEESFADIPAMHPAVDRVIPVALRRWRKALFRPQTWREWRAFKQQLQAKQYDLVIDAQGLIKSAFLTRYVSAKSAGLDKRSAREPLAAKFYSKKMTVEKNQPAIERVRQLFANAIGYDYQNGAPVFNVQLPVSRSEKPYIVFLHGTTWASKEYPVSLWQTLARELVARGYDIKLGGKSEKEIERAQQIASVADAIEFLPALTIAEMATLLAGAHAAVTVDTGFGHLAAALGVKTVSIFGSTNAKLTGMVGADVMNLSANFSCSPCMNRKCTYAQSSEVSPACYETVPPERIVSALFSASL